MENKVITEEELKTKARKISVKEGCAYSINDGFGLRYITPYALALGANNMHIGFLSSLPSMLGNFFQLHTVKLMEKFSRRRIVFTGVLSQAIMWLLIIGVGILFFNFHFNSNITPILLIFVYALLIICGTSINPIWSSWMKDLVPKESGKYFGTRNRIGGFVALTSMLIAGFILDYFKQTKIFIGFIILFGMAFIGRSTSAFFFTKQYEPKITYEKGYYFSFLQFLKAMPKNNFGKFVIFTSLMSSTTAIAAPFFAVYMLKNLNFGYVEYIIVTISSSLASLLFMPLWGKFADRYGNIRVLKICGLLVPFVPLLWLASPFLLKYNHLILFYLIVIEAFSGFSWAGFNLSSSNFVYDAVTRQRMALCVSYFSIITSVGGFLGAVFGGFVASRFTFLNITPILYVFVISGIARLIIYLIMNPKLKEVREVKRFGIKEVKERVSAFNSEHILGHLNMKSFKPRDPH